MIALLHLTASKNNLSATFLDMTSIFFLGELSTWQCEQACDRLNRFNQQELMHRIKSNP